MSLLDTASLIVTPNGYKEGKLYSVIPSDGSGDMSVVRATTATRVNSAGLVELVPYNLCDYSEDQTQWTSQDETTVTANSTTAPNGTLTADTVTPTAVNTDHYRGIVLSSQVGELTAFIYVKPNGYNFFDWGIWNGSQYLVRATFDLVNLTYTFTNAGTATIESVGNGWLKCGISGSNASLSTIALYYRVRPTGGTGGFTGNGTSGAFIWGAQLNIGSTALPYQKTETRLNIPRLDYSNGTCPSLLVEPQRTNLLTYSSSFDNAAWTKVQTTTSANVAVSPSGIQDADKLIPNTTSNIHYSFQNISDTIAPWTFSVYAKADGYNRIILNAYNTNFVGFNLTTGTIESTLGIGVTSANIEDAGNGWYRCSITSTSTSSGVAMTMSVFNAAYTNGNVNPIFSGNGTDGVLVWGAQFESGSYPTSYIPTTSASVTRNADVISKTGISSLIGQTEGTLFVDFIAEGFADFGTPLCINDGSTANSIWITTFGNGDIRGEVFGSSNVQATFTYSGGVVGQRYKLALVYKANDFAMYVNGNLIGTDLSGTLPINLSRVDFDYANASLFVKSALEINAAALWQTRLDNATLAQLTTI
jgi:hypothetical protein